MVLSGGNLAVNDYPIAGLLTKQNIPYSSSEYVVFSSSNHSLRQALHGSYANRRI
jgi:hypothetical protein